MDGLLAREADIIARKTALYIDQLQNRPKTLFISENAAFEHYRQRNITQWAKDGLINVYERWNGKQTVREYKVMECDTAAAYIQYPFWKIKTKI